MYKVLFLEKYNNYFNRIIKGHSNIADYLNDVENFYLYDKEINFSFSDNVSTELVINDCPFDPDYVLLLDENAQQIISRWFVIESSYTRKGQKNLQLRRDVIYDHISKLMNSPVFVHKGWLQDNDPFILNDEGMSFNEIKTEETLLKDKTESAWLIGYIARNVGSQNIELQLEPETTPSYTTLNAIATEMGISEAKLSGVINQGTDQSVPSYFTNSIMIKYRGKVSDFYFLIDGWEQTFDPSLSNETYLNNFIDSGSMKLLYVGSASPASSIRAAITANKEANKIALESVFNRPYFTSAQLNILKKYANNQTLILQSGVYYTLNIITAGTQVNRAGPAVYSSFGAIGSSIYAAFQNPALSNTSLKENGEIFIDNNSTLCYLQLKPATIGTHVPTLKTEISASRKVLFDNTFDMFAIPFGEITVKNGGTTFKTDPLAAKKIAIEIARELSSSCYDIQLLPYCPFESIMSEKQIDITNLTVNEDYDFIKAVDENNVETNTSIILWAQTNTFSLNLDYQLALKDSVKVECLCNKYRLCSPNYQGSFDFNVAKNGGSVAYFVAECTYKPYTPYIKVVPQLSYMYGANYGDARGLICGGDFSTPRLSDAWEEYELNNKNYQNIFNRDVQHLDFEHSIETRNAIVGGITGILTGGAAGAAGGAMAGGGWGALAGGIIGTAGSGVGMGFDMHFLARQQIEQKQYMIDKYNYQLGNIKALPYTLTKVGAFNINSKIWPFIEYYTCTEAEKTALLNKIKYESMTVMRVDLFGDYYAKYPEMHYFKGELIRNEEIAEDNHIFEAIYSELMKGVFF